MPCFVGLDVAQAQWAMALRPSGERWAVPHAASGVALLVAGVQPLTPPLLVLEATGGLERAMTSARATAGLPVVVVHPRQVRAGARATGQLAQTEALDARALAPVADVLRPTPRPRPDAQTPALCARLGRRPPLSGMRPAAQHRLAGPNACLPQPMTAQMTWLHAASAPREDALEALRRASPRWRDNDERWQSAQGMGPVRAQTLRLERPALGTRTRQESAAWVGVAPLHGDSGTRRGKRTLWGGRAPGRTVLARSTRVATRCNPQLKALYQRLRAAGQGKQVALIACMRKCLTILNAMLKHRRPWQPQEGQS